MTQSSQHSDSVIADIQADLKQQTERTKHTEDSMQQVILYFLIVKYIICVVFQKM